MAYLSSMAYSTKERCRVEPNEQGGTLYIPIGYEMGKINVSQKFMTVSNGTIVLETRTTDIVLPIDRLIHFSAGDFLDGNIYIKESLMPIDHENPEDFLAWDNGRVERTEDNKPIWRYTMYSEDSEEYDEIVPRTAKELKQ